MMTKADIREACRRAFIWPSPPFLERVKTDSDYVFYICPCGSVDHYATRCADPGGQSGDYYADVLHCWETGQQ